MPDPDVLARMRSDWNERAGEDANYYVAFGRRDQDDDEFFASAADVVRGLEADFPRLRGRGAALEIGCGPGRLMRPLSRHFSEIHGVDVSDEMIRLARYRLRNTPNAHPRHASGSDLAAFAEGTFDFVYSYAVFQHIPSRDVVLNYLIEARRVLAPSGVLRCQINGLPADAKQYDTWSGVRFSSDEVRAFAREHDFQLLALEGVRTQYMWITCRKMPAGWSASLAACPAPAPAHIRSIGNAYTGEAVAPASGPMASISLWIEDLPRECDLNHLTVTADGAPCRLSYLGEPAADRVSQLNAALPAGVRTGLVPVELGWLGRPLAPTGWIRVIPPSPAVPRIAGITDGVNLLAERRIESGSIKVVMAEVERPADFHAPIDGLPARNPEHFCVDPLNQRYEFNFDLPEGLAPGPHTLAIALGRRSFASAAIEVV
jgi:SAM-dependent methyltransferase